MTTSSLTVAKAKWLVPSATPITTIGIRSVAMNLIMCAGTGKSMVRASWSQILAWGVILFGSLFVAIGIARLANSMAPVRDGNSNDFWRIACGISPHGEKEESFGGVAYIVDSNWAAYDVTNMHGSELFKVPVSIVEPDFDKVMEHLSNSSGGEDESDFVKGFNAWLAKNPKSNDVANLLEFIKKERLHRVIGSDPGVVKYIVYQEMLFWQRWERAKWYWANVVFEWIFLTGLILFALWPTVRESGTRKQAVHFAFVPLLFYFPSYLGYATYSFTTAGPSGGILYPYLLRFFRIGKCNRLDLWLLEYTPRILEPLSVPIGSPIALTGRGFPGPTTTVLYGVLLSCAYIAMLAGIRRRRSSVRPVDYEQSLRSER